ncbi:fatty acid--CoA ligase [Qipengyuania sp. DGS5-3]|uniref:fatty acid--CoA ligase n=1 Tax=Qipengyuania sp. DGS5-3 TaxID=3349632 RepID=UPI0036D249E9
MSGSDDFLTFHEFIAHWAKDRPDRIAIEQEDRTISFGELDDLTKRLVGVLQAHGIGKGDRIAWLGKNRDIFYALFLAGARIGAVTAPIGWRLAPAEIAYILGDTGAKLVVTGDGFEEAARGVVASNGLDAEVMPEHALRDAAGAAEPASFTPSSDNDPVLQLYTSGTTGNPKGAELTNASLLALRGPSRAAGFAWTQYEPDDAMLVAMPCAHIGGLGIVISAISSGIKSIIQEEFDPATFLEGVERGGTHMFIVPAALQMVIQHPKAATTDFSGIKFLMYGAAPMPLELLKEAVKTMPQAGMLQVFGMTETCGSVSMLPPEDHSLEGNVRMRSAGKAMPGVEIKIVDVDGDELPRGEIGEIAVKSPSNMLGYWNLPDATKGALRDGWMYTGDAALMDADGYIYIQDRIKDMIISGGENVYPAEVESAIYGHPAIAEVAVIGVPDEKWGEAVKACVVCKPGENVDEDDVIAYARERVAAFKAPKSIDVIDVMPRNPSGKILRRQLREPYWAGQERQVN